MKISPLFIIAAVTCLAPRPASAENLNLSGYVLTFDEEFNGRSISQSGVGTTWADIRSWARYDAASDIGFGKSSFLDAASGYDPFSVSGGGATITGIPYTVRYGYPGSWQSGILHTRASFAQSYGYFEMRAQFNSVPGTWPGFWLLPVTTVHPAGRDPSLWQEIDIVEQYGAYTQGVFSVVHTTMPAPSGTSWNLFSSHPEIRNGFHTYGVDWEPATLKFFVDGVLMGSMPTPDDMIGPMFPLIDLARDNAYPGNAPAMSMIVDYVRVFSKAPNAVSVKQDAVSPPDGHDPGLHGATAQATPLPDVVALGIGEDAFQGDCEYTVAIDGVQFGGVRTAAGSRGKPQAVTMRARLPHGPHAITVAFLNAAAGAPGQARTLYVTGIGVDGVTRAAGATQSVTGPKTYVVTIP